MSTEIRISVSRGNWKHMKRQLDDFMISSGYHRSRSGSYKGLESIDVAGARSLINGIYDIEAKHDPSQVVTLKITSPLVVIDLRRSKYRSI